MRHFDGAITAEHLANGKEKSATTTQLVSKITLSNGRTISYKYDEEERINKVIDSLDGIIVYDYDALGQLKTETVNGTVVNAMSYDNYGNITEKNGVAYTYDTSGVWKDLLTQVGTDESGKIEYDANGNPIKYLGHDLDWEKGRQLKSFDGNTYTYNANGIRTSKTVDGVMHTYTLDGAKILCETWGENTLIPLYDNEDSVCGILYNGTPYYFIKNLQGDVIAIVDKDAEPVAKYTYDAWGKVLATTDANGADVSTDATHIGNINPFRYRGYYYDREIGLYYLQSRYYDASVGRFVNADEENYLLLSVVVKYLNLLTYCENYPTITSDPDGQLSIRLKLSIIAGLAYGIYNTGSCYGVRLNSVAAWSKLALAFAKGFIRGFSAIYTFGKNKKTLAAIVVGIVTVINDFIEGTVTSLKTALKSFLNGYTATTSVALGQKIIKGISSSEKLREGLSWIWDTIFG